MAYQTRWPMGLLPGAAASRSTRAGAVRTAYDVLAGVAAADARWKALNFTIGHKGRAAEINVNEASAFSSLCGPTCSSLRCGTWRFHKAVAFMHEQGFEIGNITPLNYDQADSVLLLGVGCIFRVRRAQGANAS